MLRILVIAGALAGAVCAQSADIATYRATVRRMVTEVLRHGQTYEMLSELCRVAPARLSGTEDFDRAVAWAKARLEKEGFEVRLEPCKVPHWSFGRKHVLRVVSPESLRGMKLPVVPLGGSVPTPKGGLRAGVIEVQSLGELRALGEKARGRFVFFNRPMDPALLHTFQAYGGAVRQRSRGAVEASKAGGVAAIVRSMTTLRDDHPHAGAMRYDDEVKRVPAAAVSTLGADRLSKALADGAKVELELVLDCAWHDPVDSFNVVADYKGREKPDEIVVIGGHLDAWPTGTGAHDDGAGVTQCMEAIRLLKSMGLRPRRTIRCVLFANEENGLAGGRAYHARHLKAMDRHVAAIESDRGGFTPRGFTTDANRKALAILREAAGLLSDLGAGHVYPGSGGADISPMAASGVPLIGYLPDGHRYFDVHHSALDVIENVNERELELGAACIAALAYVIADLPEPLPRNPARKR